MTSWTDRAKAHLSQKAPDTYRQNRRNPLMESEKAPTPTDKTDETPLSSVSSVPLEGFSEKQVIPIAHELSLCPDAEGGVSSVSSVPLEGFSDENVTPKYSPRMADFLQSRGLDAEAAIELASRLKARQSDFDDRRVCFECQHLRTAGRLRCSNSKAAELSLHPITEISTDTANQLQRCPGFQAAIFFITTKGNIHDNP